MADIHKILAVRNDRFGEFLLTIPALRALKQNYPQAKLTLVVNPYLKELAQSIEIVDEVVTWESKKHRLSEVWEFSQGLKRKRFDLCIIFNPSQEFNIIGFLAAIPVRIGYARKWGFLLTHKIKDEKHLGLKHEIEYNLELTALTGANTEKKVLFLNVGDSIIAGFIRDFNLNNHSDLVAIHPWTSDPIKQWPVENFTALAKRLIRERNFSVLIIGGREELTKSADFFQDLDKNLINLTGKTTLLQLAALLKKCRLLISGDSGPVHLACAVGTPVLAIFRSDIPGKNARRWGPWGNGHMAIEKDNLINITVDEVYDKAKEVLNR